MEHKQGDTFRLQCTVKNDGVVVDISNWTIASEIKQGEDIIDTLVAEKTDATNGEYTLTESESGVSANWDVGEYQMDIQYTASGIIFSTETMDITVVRDVTGAS